MGFDLALYWSGWVMGTNQRAPKSAVDLLEHVTDGGVHVDSRLLERSSSRESMLGGVINEEAGSSSRYLESGGYGRPEDAHDGDHRDPESRSRRPRS